MDLFGPRPAQIGDSCVEQQQQQQIRGARLEARLFADIEKRADPEGIVSPHKRALARAMDSSDARPIGACYRHWAHRWAFIATKARP